jgi:exopolysaccharide production protein ExoZ
MNWLTSQFELARIGTDLKPMEGLRGFAVFLVFLVHYVTLSSPWIAPLTTTAAVATALHTVGNTGVDLFFVLSGYLIYGTLISRKQRFMPYIRRRVARIYPTFTTVLAMYLLLSLAIPAESKLPEQPAQAWRCVAENFLLLSGFMQRGPIITVSWSLSYEMFYYFSIPLLIAAFRLRERSIRWRVRFFTTVLALSAFYCTAYGGPLRLVMFIAGIYLHEALNRVNAPANAVAATALLAGLAATLLPLAGIVKTGVLFLAFFLLCLCCFGDPRGWLARAFSVKQLRWLGNMSYSYYLLHGLVLKAAFAGLTKFNPPTPTGTLFFWAWLAPMFALTLVPCALLFLLVERPQSLAPRRAAPATPVAPPAGIIPNRDA